MEQDWVNEPVSTGTSIMATAFDGGVVLGADSRTTMGSYICNRVTDKLTRITEYIFCCESGSAADTQALSDIVSYHLRFHEMELGETPRVEVAAKVMQELCYEHRDQLSADIIICGWDKYKGGQVFAIPLGGMISQMPYAVGGSGSTYVYGYVDSEYRPGMSKEDSMNYVVNSLSLAMNRDGSSGGVVHLAVITDKGCERKVYLDKDLPKFLQE